MTANQCWDMLAYQQKFNNAAGWSQRAPPMRVCLVEARRVSMRCAFVIIRSVVGGQIICDSWRPESIWFMKTRVGPLPTHSLLPTPANCIQYSSAAMHLSTMSVALYVLGTLSSPTLQVEPFEIVERTEEHSNAVAKKICRTFDQFPGTVCSLREPLFRLHLTIC